MILSKKYIMILARIILLKVMDKSDTPQVVEDKLLHIFIYEKLQNPLNFFNHLLPGQPFQRYPLGIPFDKGLVDYF